MADTFRALLVEKTDTGQAVRFADWTDADLMAGDVTVAVSHSTVNYKDGLAVTGKAPIIRTFPLVPGIDFAGTVTASDHSNWKPGDQVILNGWGVGETHHGGFAGSIAIAVLSKLGYTVVASTGRPEEEAYLKGLGATRIVDRNEFSGPVKALAKMRWAGAVDAVGSTTLANVLSQINYGGAVAACGLAQGADLPASVMPFILRSVKLIGCDSVTCPMPRRVQAWARLATDLDRNKLAAMTHHIRLADVPKAAEEILAGKVRGRLVVDRA